MVIFVAMTAMLVGAALGQRFKVFALVPTVLLFSLAIFAYGIIHNHNLWSAFVVTVLALIIPPVWLFHRIRPTLSCCREAV